MSKRNILFASVLAILVSGVIAATGQKPKTKAKAPDVKALERLQLAQEGYKVHLDAYAEGFKTIESLPVWSRRLMDAEVIANHDPVKAAQAHLDRMQTLLNRNELKMKVGSASKWDLAEAKYDVMEAEWLLEAAKAEKK